MRGRDRQRRPCTAYRRDLRMPREHVTCGQSTRFLDAGASESLGEMFTDRYQSDARRAAIFDGINTSMRIDAQTEAGLSVVLDQEGGWHRVSIDLATASLLKVIVHVAAHRKPHSTPRIRYSTAI